MSYSILAHASGAHITEQAVEDFLILGTTTGLAKQNNEDFIGFRQVGDSIIIALADGHWGDEAARRAVELLLSLDDSDYNDDNSLKNAVIRLQDTLFDNFAVKDIDANTTKTPETSLLLCIVDKKSQQMKLMGYGDCRAFIVRGNTKVYEYTMKATWLGVFSKVGLRDRMSIDEALTIDTITLEAGDTILLYTDGIDESVYEVPTTDVEQFVLSLEGSTPSQLFDALLKRVFDTGAEDNASLAIVRV